MLGEVKRYRPPKAIVIAGVVLVYAVVDVVAPLAVSRLGPRRGWDGSRPSPLNLVGAPLIVLGAVVVVRALAAHERAIRARDWDVVKIDRRHLLTPEYLAVDGIYRWSRNPLYVGDVTMWLGWAVFLGSLPVVVGAVLLIAGLPVGVRLEERGLVRQFGDAWRQYARDVPRFVGRPRSSRPSRTRG